MCSSACSISFVCRYDVNVKFLKPESGCSGPPRHLALKESRPCSNNNPTRLYLVPTGPFGIRPNPPPKTPGKTQTAFACSGASISRVDRKRSITERVCQLDHRVRNGRGFLAARRKDTSRSVGVGEMDRNHLPDPYRRFAGIEIEVLWE